MAIWTKELDMQFVRLLRTYTGANIWDASKARPFDWQHLFDRASWPPSFTSTTLNLRWADAFRRWQTPGTPVARDRGNRALIINFDHLETLITAHHRSGSSASHGKRKAQDKNSDIVSRKEPLHEQMSELIVTNHNNLILTPPPITTPTTPAAPDTIITTTTTTTPLQLTLAEEDTVSRWLYVAAKAQGSWVVRFTLPLVMDLEDFSNIFSGATPPTTKSLVQLARALVPTSLALIFPSIEPGAGTSSLLDVSALISQRISFMIASSTACKCWQVIGVFFERRTCNSLPVLQKVQVWNLLPATSSTTDNTARLPLPLEITSIFGDDRISHSSVQLSSNDEQDFAVLYLIAKAAAHWQASLDFTQFDVFTSWPGRRVACHWILSQFLNQQSISLCPVPLPVPLGFAHSSITDALETFNIHVPIWLKNMWQTTTTTAENNLHAARENFYAALAEVAKPNTQLEVVTFTPNGKPPQQQQKRQLKWFNRSKGICLLAESGHNSYAAVLRIAQQPDHSILVESNLPDAFIQLSIDGVSVSFFKQRELCFSKYSSRLDARFCDEMGNCVKVTVILEEARGEEVLRRQQQQQQQQPLYQPNHKLIDGLLNHIGLQLHTITPGDNSLLRAILAALHRDTSDASIQLLYSRIWDVARKHHFHCDLLLQEQQIELAAFESSTMATALQPATLTAFFKVCCIWAASVIEHDILFLTMNDAPHDDSASTSPPSPSFHCIMYTTSSSHFAIPILDVQQKLLSRAPTIVLVHQSSAPTFHVDWASLLVQRSIEPSALSSTPPVVRYAPLDHAIEQLLAGKPVNLNGQRQRDSWWTAFEPFLSTFRFAIGKVVVYNRDQSGSFVLATRQEKEAPTTTSSPALLSPSSECSVENYLHWYNSVAHIPQEKLSEIYCLIDIPIADHLFRNLYESIPLLQFLNDRCCPYSIYTYLYRRFRMIDHEPRLNLTFASVTMSHGGDVVSCNNGIHLPNQSSSFYNWFIGSSGPAINGSHHQCIITEFYANQTKTPSRHISQRQGDVLLFERGRSYSSSYTQSSHPPHPPPPSSLLSQPSPSIMISLTGNITWLGRTTQEASINLARILEADTNGLASISLLACLSTHNDSELQQNELHRFHLRAMFDFLHTLLTKEIKSFEGLPIRLQQSVPAIVNRDQLWTCQRCNGFILNTTIWRQNDETFCIECFLLVVPPLYSESCELSFHFGHPSELFAQLQRVVQLISANKK